MYRRACSSLSTLALAGLLSLGLALGACTSDAEEEEIGTTDEADPGEAWCDEVADWDPDHVAFEDEVIVRVNELRAAGYACASEDFPPGAGALVSNSALRCAARKHSLDMGANDYFGHQSPDDVGPKERIDMSGYVPTTWGENIAGGQPSPESAVDAWMDSDGHCKSIMNPDFEAIGVGYAQVEGSSYTHYWTQVFGAGG